MSNGPAVDVVVADEVRPRSLVDGRLAALALQDVLAADVDVAGVRLHRDAGDQAALDQQVRIVAHDLAILARAGLRFVGVDDEVGRPRRVGLGHERPFEPGREAGAAAAAQARRLHLVDDPVAALLEQPLGAVPVAARARAVEAPVAEAVEVGEDAVLVLEHRSNLVFFGRVRRRLDAGRLGGAIGRRPLGRGLRRPRACLGVGRDRRRVCECPCLPACAAWRPNGRPPARAAPSPARSARAAARR